MNSFNCTKGNMLLNNCFAKYFCLYPKADDVHESSFGLSTTFDKLQSLASNTGSLTPNIQSLMNDLPEPNQLGSISYEPSIVENIALNDSLPSGNFLTAIENLKRHLPQPAYLRKLSDEYASYSNESQALPSVPVDVVYKSEDLCSLSRPSKHEEFLDFVAQQAQELDLLLDKVTTLVMNEHLLDAHVEYLILMEKLNIMLKKGELYAFCVIRPKGFLETFGSNSVSTINIRTPTLDGLSLHPNDINVQEIVLKCKRCAIKLKGSKSSLRSSASLPRRSSLSMLGEPLVKINNVLLLNKGHEHMEHSISEHQFCLYCCVTKHIVTKHPLPQAHRGALAEPIILCPLSSQTTRGGSFGSGSFHFNLDHYNEASPTMVMDERCMLEDLHDIDDSSGNLGRCRVQDPVWFMGELPALVYAVQNDDAETPPETKVASGNRYCAPFTFQCSPQTLWYPSALNKDVAAELPVDIQIILVNFSSEYFKNSHQDRVSIHPRQCSSSSYPYNGSVYGVNGSRLDVTWCAS